MARISKRDHARILQLVDVEQVKVAEVAAEYGCSPANVYALLGKLRRAASAPLQSGRGMPPPPSDAPLATLPDVTGDAAQPADLFAVAVTAPAVPAVTPARAAGLDRESATVTELPQKGSLGKRGGIGASLAKPGFGLAMRTADGDENLTPFRSLEDLLSAVKPILRAAARSQDAVWFSIRQIDLSMLEFDAA